MASKSKSSGNPADNSQSTQPEVVRSRSEIESALSGKTSRSKKKARPAASKAFDLNAPPRRQQVIGGDLTGVANRPTSGFFSRYSNIGVTNWLAGIIVILILAAFFWPQEKNSTQEVVGPGVTLAPQLGETDLSEAEQSDFLENEAGESALSFSRDDDIGRASNFRQQDAQDIEIRMLLDQAEAQVNSGRYTQPKANNAINNYQKVLSINPRNVEARQGLDLIADRFLTSGLSALEQNNKSLAVDALSTLTIIRADSDQYLELEAAIEFWNNQRTIELLLANAKSAFGKRALVLPAKENALYFYQQVLLLDGANQAALLGVQRVGDSYIQQANDAVLNGQYEAASAHLATVSIIDPDHASIALVEAMIARAKPLAERALAAQQQQLEQQASRLSPNRNDEPKTPAATPSETPPVINDTRTPRSQTSEQQAFDKQYLKQGLEAYYKGEYSTAAALLQPLADKGIARAQFRLAYMHYLGRGFNSDRAIADSIIRAALPAIQKFADDGRAWAQSDLGSLYEDGLVLPRNYTDAVYWYRSAAKQGYPGAQTNLGMMYARGRGVTTSRRTAIEWFQKAAEQGDSVAQRNLETMDAN
jgi:hypothetical protein